MEENTTSLNISSKIKKWRKEKGITQDSLAKEANIPYTTLAKIESGVIKNPSIQTMNKIAIGLAITLDQLIN